MSKLSDIMGDEFAQKYESKREERREQARRVGKETLMEICYQAIEGGGFDGEEPRFRFDADEIDHDVLLMESPSQDLQKFRHQLGDDAMTLGMFHLDQLFSCAFQNEMLDLLDKIEKDEYYVVVGRYQEKTQEDGSGKSQTYYNINPVRGIVPIEVARQYSDNYKEQLEGATVEQQAEEQQAEVEEDEDDDSDVDLGGISEEESGVDRDKIIKVFHAIGTDAPEVLEAVADGEQDAMDKLVAVSNNNLDSDADRERILDIFEEEVEEIPGRGEDEEDEDDGIDLGGIGADEEEDSSSDDENSGDSEEPGGSENQSKSTPTGGGSAGDSEDGEESGVEDWF